jgi:hypothetical protein
VSIPFSCYRINKNQPVELRERSHQYSKYQLVIYKKSAARRKDSICRTYTPKPSILIRKKKTPEIKSFYLSIKAVSSISNLIKALSSPNNVFKLTKKFCHAKLKLVVSHKQLSNSIALYNEGKLFLSQINRHRCRYYLLGR